MHDLVIRSARICDSLSRLDFTGNVAIESGRIAEVSPAVAGKARREIDASGLVLIPGIVDSHMHASSWLGGSQAFRMLAKAGVTTAMEMAGPAASVLASAAKAGCGLTIGCLEQMRPGVNIPDENPGREVIEPFIERALAGGALGVKILGGHYPLTPEAAGRVIACAVERKAYLGIHAGSTRCGSNLEGFEEVVELAGERPLHLAHINACCRGAVLPVEEECRRARQLLESHRNLCTESYLSPINASSAKCRDGVPESGVARASLKLLGCRPDEAGMERAIREGAALVHLARGGATVLASPEEGLAAWRAAGTDIGCSFSGVNPAYSRFFFATAKTPGGEFLVKSFSTDGGGIPRNVILKNGLCLVRFGAMTLQQFVEKACLEPARALGLKNKGHLSIGADAGITVFDMAAQEAVHSFSRGRTILENGAVRGEGGSILCAPEGAAAVRAAGCTPVITDIGRDGYYSEAGARPAAAAA